MQEDRLLKQITSGILIFLCIVICYSGWHTVILAREQKEEKATFEESGEQDSAGEENRMEGQETEWVPFSPTPAIAPDSEKSGQKDSAENTDSGQQGENPDAFKEGQQGISPAVVLDEAWSSVYGAKDSALIPTLAASGEKAIVIAKKGFLRNAKILLEENPVERELRVTLEADDASEQTGDWLQRVSEDTYYCGMPPTPTVTPTPTPKLSVSPTPKLTLTPIPSLVPGDPLYEYRYDPVRVVSMEEKETENEKREYSVTFILDKTYVYELLEDEFNFYILLKRPKDVYSKIVVLDAGHGGLDAGALSADNRVCEKDINLDIVLKLFRLLEDRKDIKVYLTRATDVRPSLMKRVNLANDVEADFFLSIHCNSNESRALNGTEVLYNAWQNEWDFMNSKRFSAICLEQLNKCLALRNRGLIPREQNVTIIQEARVPVALAEIAFISNAKDLKVLTSEEKRQEIANALYEAILEGYRQLEAEQNGTGE